MIETPLGFSLDLLILEANQAKNLDFAGKLCIHPLQVNIINQIFMPNQSEIDWAQKALDALAKANGQAMSLDGKMIDLPIIRRA